MCHNFKKSIARFYIEESKSNFLQAKFIQGRILGPITVNTKPKFLLKIEIINSHVHL
jgi:hypothetical protein